MHSWDTFHRRWESMQSTDIARNTREVRELAVEFAELEQFVVYLAAQLALGQAVSAEDPVVRAFLRLRKDDDPRRALLELVGNLQHKHAPRVVTCPTCGAGVRDVRGVLDERCQFCGATVRTAT